MNSPAIRFNGQIEYSFHGDIAQIGADLGVLAPEQLNNERLSLQLWACDTPFDPAAPQGTRVAELPLQAQLFSGFYRDQTLALPPAGNRDYLMAMILMGETPEGTTRLHDVALFNNRQLFSQPQIQGRVDCQILDDSVEIVAESICNPRESENRSGSLSLELWALNAPYSGNAFSGFLLASSELGTLDGGCEWRDSHFKLSRVEPPVGEWSLVLMLREWTPAGYVTRDFRQLPELVRQPQQASPVVAATDAIPDFVPAATSQPEIKADAASVESTPAGKSESKPEQSATPVKTVAAKKAAKKTTDAKAKTKASAAKPKKGKSVKEPVSINKADVDALAAVKGLSPRLAKAIIAERPFETLEQLVNVRGLGPKMLARMRQYLCL